MKLGRGELDMAKRSKRAKTIDDLTTLTGTEYYQTEEGITFSLVDCSEDQMISMGELMKKFYRINLTQPPLAFVLQEDRSQAIFEKIYHVVMRGNFYMDIEKNQATEGPHRCRLWFRSFSPPKQAYWIASTQIMAFFFNEKEMKEAVIAAIKAKEFYMLPSNEDKPVIV